MKASARLMLSLSIVLLAPVATLLAADRACSVEPAELRCEYLIDPLGIDVTKPRLSWQLQATDAGRRGQRQTAYQVIVASTKALLDQGRGDLWSSGTVASDQSVHIVYDGEPLESGMACFWKVRVKDEKGVLSSWSTPARRAWGSPG